MSVKFSEESKECSLLIFGILKATKMLERCEMYPSWSTEKAHKNRVKAKGSEKPTLKERADDRSPKKYKISQSNVFMQKG